MTILLLSAISIMALLVTAVIFGPSSTPTTAIPAIATANKTAAKNESDSSSYQYEYGYNAGKAGYKCSNFDADCSNGLSTCDTGSQIWSNATANTSHVIGTITDKVACLHGFVSGWKVWCNTDLSLCAKFTMSSVFPGVFADNESVVGICLANASDNVPNNLTSNILSPLSKHCDGWIDETTSPSWKAFEDMSTGWTINPPITYKQLHQQQEDINNIYIVLGGLVPINVMHPPVKTWNSIGQISEKGTITIGAHPNFKEIADNGTVLFQGDIHQTQLFPGTVH